MDRKKLPIAEPCSKNFDEMDGDGHRRFCDHCDKHVTNLSDLTRREAMELLRDAGGGLCVVYTFDESDRVRFLDDLNFRRPSKSQLSGARRLIAAAAMVPLLIGLSGCDTSMANGAETYKPIDEIIEAEKRFFKEISDLLKPGDQPDYNVTVGGLPAAYEVEMGKPTYDPGLYERNQGQVTAPSPEHIEEVQVEMMGDVSAETIEQLQLQALEEL